MMRRGLFVDRSKSVSCRHLDERDSGERSALARIVKEQEHSKNFCPKGQIIDLSFVCKDN